MLTLENAFLEQIRRADYIPKDQLPEILYDDKIASRLFDGTRAALEAIGFDADSLDMAAVYQDVIDRPSWLGEDNPEGEGGIGVREPRRPKPNTGLGRVALKPEPGSA